MEKIRSIFIFIVIVSLSWQCKSNTSKSSAKPEYVIVIHGGAGTILKQNMSPQMEEEYRSVLKKVLQSGENILSNGGSSNDAVVEVISLMENSPLFNAGKGAVFTHDGKNELDASIMNGTDLNAGAVAGVTRVKNPIQLARKVMENLPHVFLVGKGAETFAEEQGLSLVEPNYFWTKRRWESLQRAIEEEKSNNLSLIDVLEDEHKFGTVGCVALDKNGNLAAGTSTGGMTNKRFGRVGDSPIIGAGTYANNKTCAVSATGHGEFFMRNMVAYDISAQMEYKGFSVEKAAANSIDKVSAMNASGGVIVLDKNGKIAMPFNTMGMYRGFVVAGSDPIIKIYKDE